MGEINFFTLSKSFRLGWLIAHARPLLPLWEYFGDPRFSHMLTSIGKKMAEIAGNSLF